MGVGVGVGGYWVLILAFFWEIYIYFLRNLSSIVNFFVWFPFLPRCNNGDFFTVFLKKMKDTFSKQWILGAVISWF